MNCFELRHGINCLILVLLARQLAVAQDDGEHDRGSEQSLSQGMSVVLVFFISIFFLTAFTSLCMRQCSNRRFFFHHRGTTSRSLSLPPRERGLDQAVVNTFPTFLYSEVKKIKIGQATLECAVCLLEFEDDEILRLLPECCHVFHPNCIDAWLILNVTCPLCRANLYPKPGQLIISHMITTTLDRNLTDHQSTSPARNVNGSGSGSDSDLVDLIIDVSDTATPELINTPNQRPPRSTPMRLNNTGNSNKFNRSYSTGHLFVQHVGENRERFTLRLPENVRSQLMKKSPSSSSPTCEFLSTVRCPRKGYRSSSVGTSRGKNYERFDSAGRSGGWNIIMTPPTLSQVNSVRSAGEDDLTATPKNLMRSIKSPLDRLFRGTDKDDGGERSNRRLIPDAQV